MPQPPRNTTPGLTHHVFSRCIEKRKLLKDRKAIDLMKSVILRAQEKYVFKLAAYQIMDNHFHFLIQTVEGEASISRIMQYIKARFAEGYNRQHNRTGPFWNERFGDTITEMSDNPQDYALYLLWYLAFNPVRKNFIADPRNYKHSSINCYLDEAYTCDVKIVLHESFISLGNTFSERVKAFRVYEEAYREKLALEF